MSYTGILVPIHSITRVQRDQSVSRAYEAKIICIPEKMLEAQPRASLAT